MEHDSFLQRAYDYGKARHPDAPIEHHEAFANSVSYAMTGMSGGFGGPSMREHYASRMIIQEFGVRSGRCTFEQAVNLLDKYCYGSLTKDIAWMITTECCFDNAPGEEALAYSLISRP